MDQDMEQSKVWIDCIGVDNLWHVCEIDKDVCKCGTKVKSKKDKDIKNSKIMYSCYECTF